MCVKNILVDFAFIVPDKMILRNDNFAATQWSKNSCLTPRNKHISVKYHYIREKVKSLDVSVIHIFGVTNPSDTFTKPLSEVLCTKWNETFVIDIEDFQSRGDVLDV